MILIKKIDRLEREGSQALATRITMRDASGRSTPGKWWIDPTRAEIQKLYSDAFQSVPPRLRGRVLRGYVAHYPTPAWDPDSWFRALWWQLRTRKDPEAKKLLRAIAAGIQAPAALGMPKHRARRQQLSWARAALARWRRNKITQRLSRDHRAALKQARRTPSLPTDVNRSREQLRANILQLTGAAPSDAELDELPLSRLLLKLAAQMFGIPSRALHDRPHKSVAFS
jgi:hypothetical protein